MARSPVTITAVMTAHAENLVVLPSLRAAGRAMAEAGDQGVACELVVVLDRATDVTRRVVSEFAAARPDVVVLTGSNGDPGLSRNQGIAAAKGDCIAILDGDDLVSRNWFVDAYRLAEKRSSSIVHPEYNYVFGGEQLIHRHPDPDDPEMDYEALWKGNYWTALVFAHRTIFEHCPYQRTPRAARFGYEDWHWNVETIALGYKHRIAKGTLHAIRRKSGVGVNAVANARLKIPRPSAFFAQLEPER